MTMTIKLKQKQQGNIWMYNTIELETISEPSRKAQETFRRQTQS